MRDPIREAVARIRAWGEAREWRGYDPYDALNSPAAALLSLGTPLGRRLLTQAVKLSPLNLRPLLRIQPSWNAKALGLIASAYARLWVAERDESAREQSQRWLDWLVTHHGGDGAGMAWGYHFDVQTRFFAYARGTPNTIATSFVAQALLNGCELLGEERFRAPARAATDYLTTRMLVDSPRGPYFRYLPREDELVHNANLLACGVLARAAQVLGDDVLLEPAARALETSLCAQRADGSWPYSDAPGRQWIDNFHTGYVLESLAKWDGLLPEAHERLGRGLDYWERSLFLADGTPKYFPDRLLPLDAHSYAQAIETWLAVSHWRPHALRHAVRTARLLIERMLDASGYVYFQRRKLWTSKVPLVRWTTAPSFCALAGLLLKLERRGAGPTETCEEHAYSRLD